MGLIMVQTSFSESNIKGMVLNIPTKIENDAGLSIRENNTTSQSPIKLQSIDITGVTVNNREAEMNNNVAIGQEEEVVQDSVVVEGEEVHGMIVTEVDSTTAAISNENVATQSSIELSGSNGYGAEINTSGSRNLMNVGISNKNKATQASTVIESFSDKNLLFLQQANIH